MIIRMHFWIVAGCWQLLMMTHLLSIKTAADSSDGDNFDDVLLLTDTTFNETLTKHKSVLVNFFPSLKSQFCKACHAVNTEFAIAAKILLKQEQPNDVDIRLGFVETEKNPELLKRLKIQNYPTIRYFRDGGSSQYMGDWRAQTIIAWLRKKNAQLPYRQLSSTDDITEFVANNEAAVIGVFRQLDSKEAATFITASRQLLDDSVAFGLVIPDDPEREFPNGPDQMAKIYVAKKFDERLVSYNEDYTSVELIVRFVKMRAFPYVVDFTPNAVNIQRTFQHTQIHVSCVLFATRSSKGFQKIYDEFYAAAKDLRDEFGDRLLFVYLDNSNEQNLDFMEIFEVAEDEPPLVMLILHGRMERFRLQSKPIKAKAIEQLIRDHFSKKSSKQKQEL